MPLKNLNTFQRFDWEEFLKGKELTVTDCRPWVDFDTHEEKGTKVETAITKDETIYPPTKDGRVVTNLFEKISIKVPKALSIHVGAVVTIVNGTATVYGEYRNQLSVKAEDIRVAPSVAHNGQKEG